MKEQIIEFIDKEFRKVKLGKGLKEVIALLIEDIMQHENVALEDITYAGSGATSVNVQIGEYVLKVGRTRETKTFKNSARILQPIIRREIDDEYGEKMFIEVQNVVDTKWIKKGVKPAEITYQVYKDLRDDGLLWTDARFSNIGRLRKDNRVNYTTSVHDGNGNNIEKEIDPAEQATGLSGKPGKILKAGEYVVLDTDFIFDVNNLPDNLSIKDMLFPLYYENYEMRYQREKRNKENSTCERD